MENLSSENIFIALLFIASLVAIIAKRLRLPYTIALTGQFSLVGSVQQFVQVAFGGALLGLLIGYFFSRLIRPIDDYLVEVALTMVLAYGIFFLAEALHISGVIAVVTAGLVVGNYGTRIGMSPTTRRECLRTQKSALLSLLQQGVIFEEVYRDLVTGLDRQLETIDEWVSSQPEATCPAPAGAPGERSPSPAGE